MLSWIKHSVKGYHFSNKRLGYGDNRLIEAGKTYEARFFGSKLIEKPALCRPGMHASKTPYEALLCAPAADCSDPNYKSKDIYVSEVIVHGVEFFRDRKNNKFVGTYRTHIKIVKLDFDDRKNIWDLMEITYSYDPYLEKKAKRIEAVNYYVRNILDASDS